MSLSAAIAKGVDAAFVGVGDLKKSVSVISYDQTVEPSRHATTGFLTFASSSSYTGEIILAEFESSSNRANVETGDIRGIMKQSEILKLQISDLVTFDSIDHSVVSIQPDPSNSIWDCQLRRRG